MGTKYSSQSASGYNASPPADDGTVADSNKTKWSQVTGKIGAPLKTFIENINSALITHFDVGPAAISTNTTLDATHYGKSIEASSAITLILTDANTLGAGWHCIIKNAGSSAITIAPQTTSDTIDGVTVTDISLSIGESIAVQVVNGANGFMTSKGNTQWLIGGTVTSTSALPIDVIGNEFDIAGTTTCVSFNSKGVGSVVVLHFEDALRLTHHATDLILPGSTDIDTTAGDVGIFQEYALGDWRCVSYQTASLFYEKGTWTPSVWDDTASDGEGQSYDTRVGRYIRIGDLVTIYAYIDMASLGTLTTSQGVRIGGLPYASQYATTNGGGGVVVGYMQNLTTTAGYNITGRVGASSSFLSLDILDSTGATTPLTLAELSANGVIAIQGSYITNA